MELSTMNNIIDFIVANKLIFIVCHIIISIIDIIIILKIYINKSKKLDILKYYELVKSYYADEVLRYSLLSLLPIVNFIILIVLIIKGTYIYLKEIIKKIIFNAVSE